MSPSELPLSVTVLSEARELLSVLRRNRRFGYLLSFTTASQPAEHPLVKEVKSLRDIVRTRPPPAVADTVSPAVGAGTIILPDVLVSVLDPFLEVVRSRDASGIITGVALLSLDRITSRLLVLAEKYDVLRKYSVALSAIMDAAAACRFDATDPAADEVVLSRITRVIARIVTSPALPLMPDAAVLRAIEACLGIAAGRRRASDLLKRTADAVLVDTFKAIGFCVPRICKSSNAASVAGKTKGQGKVPSVISEVVNGPVFGYSLDTDSFSQHGPASSDLAVAILELSSRMSDPTTASSLAERSLGMQLLLALLESAGTSLGVHPLLKQLLLRNCSRAVLRSLGQFHSPAAIISSAFTIAIQLVHVLEEEGAPLLLALLERVYPYYISGYEKVLPQTSRDADTTSAIDKSRTNGVANGSSPPAAGNGSTDMAAVSIDPVVREIGLESLAALLSTPGLLCVAYRVADCDLSSPDIVNPLIKSLGYACKTKRARRRSKRLRASTSGSNRASPSADEDSDDEDTSLSGTSGNSESFRFARAAAMLCAESILAVIETINSRLKVQSDGSVQKPVGDASPSSREIRKQKTRLQDAAQVFNSSEKLSKASKLLPMLREHGFLSIETNATGTVSEDLDGDVKAVVQFLRETPRLSKEKIGVILGEPDALSRRVLSDYTATFEFKNRPFTESLRVFLESFRLPGEAQKIDRIVQSFANRYYEQNKPIDSEQLASSEEAVGTPVEPSKDDMVVHSGHGDGNATEPDVGTVDTEEERHHSIGVLKNADAAYVLSFSVVMLNTDQHNDSIRVKMTLDDFLRNSRGINNGEDIPKWFMADIFNSIAAVEIRMSDEIGIGALTDLIWDEQVKHFKASRAELPTIESSLALEEELFMLSWEPAVSAANSIMNEAADPNSVQTALEGFLSIARCATAYKVIKPSDAVISSLTTATILREGPLHGAIVRFGTDIKAQMACVALSGVSRQCADWLGCDGWQSLVAYLLRLHALCLLPSEIEQQVGGNGPEVTREGQQKLCSSKLIPGWWPSRTDKISSKRADEKPRKASRPNGFLAAIIAASMGTEVDSEEEEEYDHIQTSNGDGRRIVRTSHSPPYYLRMRGPEEEEAQELARKCIASCRIEDVIINEAKVLQSSALEHLSQAIARSAYRTMDAGAAKAHSSEVEEEERSSLEDSILEWTDISPPSPKNDSSAIVGIANKNRMLLSAESEQDFSSFGLSSAWTGEVKEKDERKAREFVIAFCIDVLTELTLQNRDRLQVPWPSIHGLMVRVIAPATEPSAVLERAIVSLLRVGVRLLHREEVRDDVLRGLNLLVRLPSDAAEVLSVPIASGIYNIVKAHGSSIHSTSGWHAILSILESSARYQPAAREMGLETLFCLLKDTASSDAVCPETFTPLLHAILAYTSCSSIEVSIRALDLLHHLSERIQSFSSQVVMKGGGAPTVDQQRADSEMWSEFWGPLFLGFAASVRDARGKVRNSALAVLERVVASGNSAEFMSAAQWSQALSTVLLPLMNQLFTSHGFFEATIETEQAAQMRLLAEKNASFASNRGRSRSLTVSVEHQEQLRISVAAACNRTRMKAVTLTSKTFLQHHVAIASGLSEDAFTELWIGVLEVFRIAIESGTADGAKGRTRALENNDDLIEHVPESVKNLLLVMCDCGLLKSGQHVRWNATFAVVGRFLPDIEEIISAATQDPLSKRPEEPEREESGSVRDTAPEEKVCEEQNPEMHGMQNGSMSTSQSSISVTSST